MEHLSLASIDSTCSARYGSGLPMRVAQDLWVIPHLVLLHQVGEHDDGGHIVVPHHPPEISHCVRHWTLCGDVFLPSAEPLHE